MSCDFIGLFDVTVEAVCPEWLHQRLSSNPPPLAELIERCRHLWHPQSWTIEFNEITAKRNLVGPGGFSFEFSNNVVQMYHVTSFYGFACKEHLRVPLRQVCRYVAGLLGSSRSIYTHEVMPWEGSNLSEIEGGLHAKIGPPAANFDELCQSQYFEPRAWYIDDFSDRS